MQPSNILEGPRPELVLNLESQLYDKVSIIIVHKDRPRYLNLCIQSIDTVSSNLNYEIIVVDNGSKDEETLDYLNKIEDQVKLIRNPDNFWWTKAANQGAKAADPASNYFMFMHHDTVVLNRLWIDMMVNTAELNKSGIVGLSKKSYQIMNQKIDFVADYCVLISKKCFEEVGPFDERLQQEGAPFIFSYKANLNGYNPKIIDSKYVHHFEVFALNYSEWEQQTQKAATTLPVIIREIQLSRT